MELKNREIRTIVGDLHIREVEQTEEYEKEDSRKLCGRAIVFNAESEILDEAGMTFREVIKPEACTAEFLNGQDVKLNLLHDRAMTIGRKNERGEGNLKLDVREDGVYFEIDLPKCDIAERCLELVRAGVYTGCSFEFYPGEYDIQEREGQTTIIHTRFAAVTALTVGLDPAYKQTSVNVREMTGTEHHEDADLEEQAKQAERERKLRLYRHISEL